MSVAIPEHIRIRQPAIDERGLAMLERLQQHAFAPVWNHAAGDRLEAEDLQALAGYRERLAAGRRGFDPHEPSDGVLRWVSERRDVVASFRTRLGEGVVSRRDWARIKTMSREDVAVGVEHLVPDAADLEELIVYRTAGTTGHALLVPHHPRAAACYQVLIEAALFRYGVRLDLGPEAVACFLVGAQARTVTYPCVLSAWGQSGFAKINLSPGEWREPSDPERWFEDLEPRFLTGDPISFHELMRRAIPARPAALVSTAVAMSQGLKRRLAEHFECPVIDWYSLTETGPIGYACPIGPGYHVLPHDLHVEAIDPEGRPLPPDERGEITVTGGRNPYLPLLRYRTGDWGRMDPAPCSCGDPMPRILDLEGREPVIFRSATGGLVNPVDLSRVLRRFPFVQHEMSQKADLSCELVVRPVVGGGIDLNRVKQALTELLGELPIEIRTDAELGNRTGSDKVLPFRSELLLED